MHSKHIDTIIIAVPTSNISFMYHLNIIFQAHTSSILFIAKYLNMWLESDVHGNHKRPEDGSHLSRL